MIVLFFAGSLMLSGAIYVSRSRAVASGLLYAYGALFIALTSWAAGHIGEVQVTYFRVDELGFVFLLVQAIITVAAIIHSIVYERERNDLPAVVAGHHASLVLFLTVIAGAITTTHAGALWGFLEASTLTASILIFHHRTPVALEATWKYLFVASVGIALAFGGILFVVLAGQEAGLRSLFFDDIRQDVTLLDPTWLRLSFVLILSGFSVKMGLVPLFNVDIDAKDISPSPIGALFSTVLMNAGFVAIFRFYESFSGGVFLRWMNEVLIITGVLSLFLAAVYLMRVQNLKRLLAYSSLEHAGIVVIALASGGIGRYAAILHLVLHSFAKSSLFFQTGQIYRFYVTKRISDYGGYLRLYPVGGMLLLLGLFCIVSLPPGGLFFTQLMTFSAVVKAGYLWVAVFCLVMLLYILAAMGVGFFRLLFGSPATETASTAKPSRAEAGLQFVLLGLVIMIGLHTPNFLKSIIYVAVQNLP